MGIYMYGRWPFVKAKTWEHYVPRGRWKRVFVPTNGSVGPLSWQSILVSLTHPCCGYILALSASKKFQFVFWCQVSPADRSVVDRREVFCYVVALVVGSWFPVVAKLFLGNYEPEPF